MATILQNLPADSEITKIEYEGPRIALYSTSPSILLKNPSILSNMVNLIKKRIVIRTDDAIRKEESEVTHIIESSLPKSVGFKEIYFDPAIGEATILVSSLKNLEKVSDFNIDLMEKTGWIIKASKLPQTTLYLKKINDIIKSSANERIKFFKDVGEKIFRNNLLSSTSTELVALGGFAELGRSCLLVSTHESKVLVDCGINIYAKEGVSHYPRMDITGMKMNDIDAVLITHSHLDHCGFLPHLYKYGYSGPVYCTPPTMNLMAVALYEYQKEFSTTCTFSEWDIEKIITHTITLGFSTVTDISPDIKVVFSNSGHTLGSAMIHMHIGSGDHNLVYTGDFKFSKCLHLENASWNFPRVETLVIESTFGAREDIFSRDESIEKLKTIIDSSIEQRSKILVPVSLSGTAQELILLLKLIGEEKDEMKEKFPKVYVEQAIAESNSIHEFFYEYLSKDLQEKVKEYKTSIFKTKNFSTITNNKLKKESAIILANDKSLQYGPVLSYLEQIVGDPDNTLLFTSYQPTGSLGRTLKDGETILKKNNVTLEVKCKKEYLYGFDNHSDYNQTMAFVSRLRPKLKRVIVNHGERAKAQNLASSINKTFKVQTQHPLIQESIRLL